MPTRRNAPEAGARPVRASASPVATPIVTTSLPSDPDDLSGTVLGSYRLIAQIGVGGIGHVYRAEHVRLSRQVAIKRLRPEYAAHPSVVQRFFAEAKAANQIAHENIVEITDFVEDDPAGTYLIMELLKGCDVGQLLDREHVLPLDRALRILVQATRALAAAHAEGIVHRDLKPDNIFLIERAGVQDFVKLLDFGVAKLTQQGLEGADAMHRTAAGIVLGTPAYMAPEQAAGQATDHRIDVYALGVIMYELTTGKLPFVGSSLGELIVKHSTTKPDRPSKVKGLPHTIPDAFEKLILRCLEKSPDARPQTMTEVEAALVAIAAAEGWPLEAFAHTPPPTYAHAKPRSWPLVLAFLLFAAGVSALSFVLVTGKRAPSAQARMARLAAGAGRPAPRRVAVRFESSPAGAEVWRVDGTSPLGITPFQLDLTTARGQATQTFEFRLAGHRIARHDVPVTEDRIVVASLARIGDADVARVDGDTPGDSSTRRTRRVRTPEEPPEPDPVTTTTNEIDRNAVIDPFTMQP